MALIFILALLLYRVLKVVLKQGCATGGPRATTLPAEPFSVALANTLIFPHHA